MALLVLLLVLGVPAAGAWTWPVGGPVLQGFSFDPAHPYAGGQHRGIDVGGDAGAPVLAPAAGVVSFAGTVPTSGKSVTIDTADGLSVTLTHLGSIAVAKDASVTEGVVVGRVGTSGTPELDVPYVHLGIRSAADPQGYLDPLLFLPVAATAPAAAPAATPVAPPAAAAPPAEPAAAPPVSEAPPASDPPAADPAPPTVVSPPAAAAAPADATPPVEVAPVVAPAPPVAEAPAAAAAATPVEAPAQPVAAPSSAAPTAPEAQTEPAQPEPAQPEPAPGADPAPAADAVAPVEASPPAPEPTAFPALAAMPPSPALPPAPMRTFERTVVQAISRPPAVTPRVAASRPAPEARTPEPPRRTAPSVDAAVRPRGGASPVALALALAGALAAAGAAAVGLMRARMIRNPSPTPQGALSLDAATPEDPRRGRMAVCERPETPRARRRPGRAVGHLRPLPSAEGERRADGVGDGRARDAGDGVGGPGRRLAA
jgi:hypothetical protein